MKFRIGYVAISLTLDEFCHFHTLTYSSYLKLGKIKGNLKLNIIMKQNFDTLKTVLAYNTLHQIHFYRISHHIVPLASHPKVNFNYIDPYLSNWEEIGNYIKNNNIRIDSHPDQFCVLNSTRKEVIENSFRILKFNQKIFKALKIDGKVILHIGGNVDGKDESIKRFKDNFYKLPSSIRKMIILENDDKIFTVTDVLELCEDLKIPMVLDYHHYICHHGKEKIQDYLPRIFATWDNTGYLPKIHFSSPKSSKEKRSHSTYINLKSFLKFLDIIKQYKQDIDIMLECKGKDEALFRLSRQLREISYINFIDNSTFEIN